MAGHNENRDVRIRKARLVAGPDSVVVPVDQLKPGKLLRHPITDQRGLLLLAAGVELTDRFIAGLRSRGVDEVLVHRDDLSGASPPRAARVQASEQANPPREVNTRRRPLAHPYDAARSIRLERRFVAATDTVRKVSEALLAGQRVPVDALVTANESYVDEMLDDSHQTIAATLERRTEIALAERSVQLSVLSIAIGLELEWSRAELVELGTAAMVHDWGLLRLPLNLRCPQAPLTGNDWQLYCSHPLITEEMLSGLTDVSATVRTVAVQVHEMVDGTGYPRGVDIQRMHVHSRILSLAEAYMALTEPMAGRAGLVPYDAMALLLQHVSLGKFDATAMRGLLQAVSLFPIGSWVELSDQTPARVLRSNAEYYDRPVVELMDDATIRIVDLAHNDRFVTRPLADLSQNQTRLPSEDIIEPMWLPVAFP
jgi:HD-GYP domain-containing protein (c-di-GMP phosphodiesterase class II)